LKKILFVTGTDTGVGKTVLTAMLLAFLRGGRGRVRAMKPFCSGARDDARLLHSLQKECLTLDDVNPFYFDKPLAPAAAGSPKVSLGRATKAIRKVAAACDLLLVEGVGGLMVPLGRDYWVRDLIAELECKVLVVCPNQLGIINHSLLTVEALKDVGIEEFTVVMMDVRKPDISSQTNPQLIHQSLPGIPLFRLPYMGNRASTGQSVKKNVKIVKKTLAAIAGDDILSAFFNRTKRLHNKTC
jgi:dethiobiotin synthetase